MSNTVTQKAKNPAGGLNFEYTFECKCGGGAKHTIKETAGGQHSEMKAKQQAQVSCDEKCDG
jgi:hypothetical protein